jgi:hypothetical protein
VLDLIAPACKADDMETKMDCNPKCEKLYKLHQHNQSHSTCTHTLPRFFLLHQGYQDSDSNIIAIVIINSNSRSSAPQHQHTTMDGNKVLAILLHQLNSKPAFDVKPSLVSLVALSLLLPPMSQFLNATPIHL